MTTPTERAKSMNLAGELLEDLAVTKAPGMGIWRSRAKTALRHYPMRVDQAITKPSEAKT